MNQKKIIPHERKKERYALKSFLWGMLISAIFIIPSIIMGKGMYLYYGDYNMQVIPFYQLMSDAVKSGDINWSWYTDLGSSFVGAYTFYNLGSPFFWLMVPFPSDWIPYLLGPLTIIKFGLCSLTAYSFLRRYTKDKNNAVIGAMLYAFSGFSLYSMVFHFIDSMVFFPLLLTALDDFIYDHKRGRFAAMAAVCAIVNYYFFVAEVVFCLVYWIVRMAVKSYRTPAKEVVSLFFEAVMGVGLAMFILLPSLYHMIGNNRVNNAGMTGWGYLLYQNVHQYAEILISFFFPPELPDAEVYVVPYKSSWSSITGYLPLFSMSGVFAVVFNKHKNKWLRVFYAVCIVFMFVPVLNSSFQMFSNTDYVRWFFMLLLIMSMGSVMALEDTSTKWKKCIVWNMILVMIFTLIIGFIPNSSSNSTNVLIGLSGNTSVFWINTATAFINIAVCALFVSLYRRNRTAFKRLSSFLLSFVIITTMLSSFALCKVRGMEYHDIVGDHLLGGGKNLAIDDIQQWRSDIVSLDDYTVLKYDTDDIADYDYVQLEAMQDEISQLNITDKDGTYYTDDNFTMFWKIPGIQSFHSTINSSITDFFHGLELNRTTLSNWPLGMYGVRSLFSVKYMFTHDDGSLRFADENGNTIIPGWKYCDNYNGYDIYENENVLPMGFTFDHYMTDLSFKQVPLQYRHLVLLDTLVTSSVDDLFLFASMDMEQVTENDYEFTEEEYYKFCKDRKKIACYDYKRDKKGFEAKIDTKDHDEWVFFSVPYDKGWSAKVNDSPAEIKVVDFGFMAVRVPANTTSVIRFNYHTPGLFYGVFVTAVCLLLTVIYLAAMKIQSTPAMLEETSDNAVDEKTDEKTEDSTGENNDEEDISIFDIVKQTEEENMMHVFKRVPVVLESGCGAVAYDIDFKKYIDFTSGIGVNALGFANGSWIDAVEKQLDLAQHTSNIYYNTTQIQLAEILCMKTGLSKVFFANSGAEANECAIKLARKYGSDKYGTNHTHIVTLENSFHGRTITTLAATGQESFHKYFMPFTEGFSYAKANDIESIKNTVTDDTCAVMIELIQGEGGINPLDKEFVTGLAEFCKEHDILLIVDEVQTGVGRTGKLFCYENYGITPDIITSAKALGGGLPLSACLCNDHLKDVMTYGTNGTTFGGNVVACAGAMKIIDIVSDEQFLEEVREKGEYMRNRIQEMNGVKEVRGLGLMIGIVIENGSASEIQEKCAENGLLVLTAKNLIRLLPPLNIEYMDIDEGLDILEKVLGDIPKNEKE